MAVATPVRLLSRSSAAPSRVCGWRGTVLLSLLLAGLVAATRIPLAPPHLFDFDSVNFALALEHFDPRLHQPHPPGYPLFVAQARLLNVFFQSPERTFLTCSLLAAVAAPLLLFLLGGRMYSPWAGLAGALLLVLNPVFWRSTLVSPVRPYLSVLTLLLAYLCHRAAAGEARFAWYAAAALGLGAGWRPELMVLLAPLWLLCAWRTLRSFRPLGLAMLLAAAGALTWIVPLLVITGGPGNLWLLLARYLEQQSGAGSPLLGGGFWEWWEMFTQGFVWLALAVVGWFWAALLPVRGSNAAACASDRQECRSPLSNRIFVLCWIGPAIGFLTLIHVAHPGHTLAAVPALCLLGGAYLERGARRAGKYLPRSYSPRWAFLAVALAINVWFFAYPFRLPHERPQIRGSLLQAREQFRFWGAFALRHSSYADVRTRSLRMAHRIESLRRLGSGPGLTIVWHNDDVSWRKITYYFPGHPTWVLEAPEHRLWHGNRVIDARGSGDPTPLPLPSTGRVAWLLHRHSTFPSQLRAQGVPLLRFGALFLTDLDSAPDCFRAGAFTFRKQTASP